MCVFLVCNGVLLRLRRFLHDSHGRLKRGSELRSWLYEPWAGQDFGQESHMRNTWGKGASDAVKSAALALVHRDGLAVFTLLVSVVQNPPPLPLLHSSSS